MSRETRSASHARAAAFAASLAFEAAISHEATCEHASSICAFRSQSSCVAWSRHRSAACRAAVRRKHIVKLSNPGGGVEYDVGWIDVDTKLLAFCGKTIVDFIEKEQPCLDETLRGADAAEWKALYAWWTVERPSAVAASRITLRRGDAREWMAAERVIEERDTEMLIRLIKARGGMWT